MVRPVLAVMAAISCLALSASAFGQTAAQRGPQERSPAAARAPATAVPDEPQQAGPVVERRSTRGEQAGERRIGDSDIALAPVVETAKVTHHTVTVGGRPIPYAATAGTLTLRDEDGKPIASMFYVAYVADRAPGAPPRPITFLYNGGPGSASMWLHMGSFAPVRIRTPNVTAMAPAPYPLGPNPDSLIDKTDMVFLDAIGAGYSRPLGDTKGSQFWGVDEDIDAFARGITRYVSINHRWDSPKFLFGESYGTTRSAGLVYALQSQGMQFNGVFLLSSILNYGVRDAGFDHVFVTYMPSFAAAAAYHHKIAAPADLGAFLNEVRAWAAGPYEQALAKGHNISDAELDAVARQMSAYTGISVGYLKEVNLRLDLQRFRKELLRSERKTIGRYDSRYTGFDADAGGEGPEFDPSDVAVSGAFIGAAHAYLEGELGYTTNLTYRPSGNGINQAWNWKHKAPGQRFGSAQVADTAQDLGAAIRENPHLHVYSLNGLYDMATPFYGTEYDLAHMWLDPSLRGNVQFAYYPSGHMVYLNPDAFKSLRADVERMMDQALAR
ncbi:S10 family peptidase [Phenylobacterium sp.]|uniref:S10 family peptidase n=1 Tax=Phenylobacterium sp. TaxID=1871053 RepID=UPI002DE259DF|nr:peptidase S10 [Phenylobacterium sp.]